MSIMETFGGTAEKLHYKAESVYTNGRRRRYIMESDWSLIGYI